MAQQSAWDLNRPVFLRLPAESGAYQENPIVDALTNPWDAKLVDIKNKLLSFNADWMEPTTARIDVLDWLAQLCGFTDDYWDITWSIAIKRTLIANSHKLIWSYRGTKYLLEWLLTTFSLDAIVYIQGEWLIGTTDVGSAIGGSFLYYGIKLYLPQLHPSNGFYYRNSPQWNLIAKLNRLYMPCWCGSIPLNGNFLHYERFCVELSAVGDPL